VFASDKDASEGELTDAGLDLFREDMVNRVDTDFKNQIPEYLKKFINYISFIDGFKLEKKQSFLRQFPPDDPKEYQCHGGATARLGDVFDNAKPSTIAVKSHNLAVEDISIELRKIVDKGFHPHVKPFVNYLLGVDKNWVEKDDMFYLTPSLYLGAKDIHEVIKNYEYSLFKGYLDIIEGNKKYLIEEIVKITKEDNDRAPSYTGEEGEESVYRNEEIKKLLKENLDINDDEADKIIMVISEYSEIEDSDNYTYWTKEIPSGLESKSESIEEILENLVEGAIKVKKQYFEEINNKIFFKSYSSRILQMKNTKDLIGLIKVESEVSDRKVLTLEEKSAVYALRSLSEDLKGRNPMHFLVVSDHLVGHKELLLKKAYEDKALTRYVKRIFEARENLLGEENKDIKVADSNPIPYAILTRDEEKFLQLVKYSFSSVLKETFSPKNQPDNRILAQYILFQLNDFKMAKIFFDKFSHHPEAAGRYFLSKDGVANKFNMISGYGYHEVVKAMLENDFLTNNPTILEKLLSDKNKEGNNALGKAACNGHIEAIRVILESDILAANPDILEKLLTNKNENGLNVLGVAYHNGNIETVEAILESDILAKNPDILEELLNNKSKNGNNALGEVACNGNSKVVKVILESDFLAKNPEFFKELLTNRNVYGNNVLGNAAYLGKTEVVKAIMESGFLAKNPDILAEMLNNENKGDHNVLVEACYGGNAKTVTAILESDFISRNPEVFKKLLTNRDKDGNNVLGKASYQGLIEVVKEILENSFVVENPDILEELLVNRNETGDNALGEAYTYCRTEVAEVILKSAFSARNPTILKKTLHNQDDDGNNVFENATYNGHSYIVESILNVFEKETYNRHSYIVESILRSEFLSTHPDILGELLNKKNEHDDNALGEAVCNGYIEIVREILNSDFLAANPKIFKELISNLDIEGNNILGSAALKGHTKTVELILKNDFLAKNPDFFKELLSNVNDKGYNALKEAFFNNHYETRDEILKSKFLVNNPDFVTELVRYKEDEGFDTKRQRVMDDNLDGYIILPKTKKNKPSVNPEKRDREDGDDVIVNLAKKPNETGRK